MSAAEWPCFEGHSLQNSRSLVFERAIWGKVHGARTDYRWIARSPGFKGLTVGSRLTMGPKDVPCTAPLWYCAGPYCYAVWCYPSQATDAADRSGFVEKQIIEWQPTEVNAPSALGAMALLPLVASYSDSDWLAQSRDPGWSDPSYLLPLPQGNCSFSPEDLENAVAEGLRQLRSTLSQAALARFYADLITAVRPSGGNPAILSVESNLSPLALGALLLPLRERINSDGVQSRRASLAGGVASQSLGKESASAWHGVACRSEQASQLMKNSPTQPDADWAAMLASAVQQGSPALARQPLIGNILEFARGPRRWVETAELPTAEVSLDAVEVRLLSEAIDRIREQAEAESGLPNDGRMLADARARQLRKKADIVLALAKLTEPDRRWRAGDTEVDKIFEQWKKDKKLADSTRKLLGRI